MEAPRAANNLKNDADEEENRQRDDQRRDKRPVERDRAGNTMVIRRSLGNKGFDVARNID